MREYLLFSLVPFLENVDPTGVVHTLDVPAGSTLSVPMKVIIALPALLLGIVCGLLAGFLANRAQQPNPSVRVVKRRLVR